MAVVVSIVHVEKGSPYRGPVCSGKAPKGWGSRRRGGRWTFDQCKKRKKRKAWKVEAMAGLAKNGMDNDDRRWILHCFCGNLVCFCGSTTTTTAAGTRDG